MELVEVTIIESERGWGSKVDDVKYFKSRPEAEEFCEKFNSDNPTDHVPDWYMQASITKVTKLPDDFCD